MAKKKKKERKKFFKPTTQKTWEGKFPKGKVTLQSRDWEKTHFGAGEGRIWRPLLLLLFHSCPEGSSEGVGLCVVMPRYLLASLLEPALFQGGHGAAVTFYLRTLCRRQWECT